jgi:hypothetical protein
MGGRCAESPISLSRNGLCPGLAVLTERRHIRCLTGRRADLVCFSRWLAWNHVKGNQGIQGIEGVKGRAPLDPFDPFDPLDPLCR